MVESSDLKERILTEVAWFAVLAFVGLTILPLAIYVVGRAVFGDYGDGGLLDFYRMLLREFLSGEPVVWFLLLSPYLLWQLARLTLRGFRHSGTRARRLPPEA